MISDGRILNGRYRLEGKLGSGGMGSVWRAEDLTLRRVVALKELVPYDRSGRAGRRDRAEREARALARVSHPAIVGVHDIFVDEGEPWIVMHYIHGRSLAAIMRERDGRLSEREVAWIGRPVLQGLCAAHAAGVIHRDVKPANILVTEDGEVFLVDFGIARVAGDLTLTDPNRVLGTPEFLAPEQIRGDPVDGAADLWALGVTFFRALEGYSPFQRGGARPEEATMEAIRNQAPPALRTRGALAEIVTRLLRKDPAERAGAAELAAVLESVLDGPRHHEPSPPGPRPPGWERRPAPGLTERQVQDARRAVCDAGREAGAAILLRMPDQRAATILADCPAEVAGQLIAAIAAARPQTAGAIMRMLSAARAGAAVNHLTPQVAAAILAVMPVGEAVRILRHAGARTAAGVIGKLPGGISVQIIDAMPDDRATRVLEFVAPAAAASLLGASARPSAARLARLEPHFRDEVLRHLPRGTAAS